MRSLQVAFFQLLVAFGMKHEFLGLVCAREVDHLTIPRVHYKPLDLLVDVHRAI